MPSALKFIIKTEKKVRKRKGWTGTDRKKKKKYNKIRMQQPNESFNINFHGWKKLLRNFPRDDMMEKYIYKWSKRS